MNADEGAGRPAANRADPSAMSVPAAAAVAGVSEKTIRRWIKRGRLHAELGAKRGREPRVTSADLHRARGADPAPSGLAAPRAWWRRWLRSLGGV